MKINVIVEDNDGFDYDYMAELLWRKLTLATQKKTGINFGMENQQQGDCEEISIEGINDTKSVFKCELWSDCGDWEDQATHYFRCQLIDGACGGEHDSMYSSGNSYFVFIPDGDQGNDHLDFDKEKQSWYVPEEAAATGQERDAEACWKSLTKYLTDCVDGKEKPHLASISIK